MRSVEFSDGLVSKPGRLRDTTRVDSNSIEFSVSQARRRQLSTNPLMVMSLLEAAPRIRSDPSVVSRVDADLLTAALRWIVLSILTGDVPFLICPSTISLTFLIAPVQRRVFGCARHRWRMDCFVMAMAGRREAGYNDAGSHQSPQSPAQPNKSMARYVHTLRFTCPYCGTPVEATRISDEENREGIDAQPFPLDCDSCEKTFNAPGWRAESHTVSELRE